MIMVDRYAKNGDISIVYNLGDIYSWWILYVSEIWYKMMLICKPNGNLTLSIGWFIVTNEGIID